MNWKQHMWLWNKIVKELTAVHIKKHHDYNAKNDSKWIYLGLKGNFHDIYRKVGRLETIVWENKKPLVNESIRETLKDLAVYAIMGIMIFDIQNKKEENKNARIRKN